MRKWAFLDVDNTTAIALQEVAATALQRLKRMRCWLRFYHIIDAAGVDKFRFDCDGICHDCGTVGGGVSPEDGE